MEREYTGYKLFKTVKNEKEFFKHTDKLYDERKIQDFRRLLVEFFEDELHVFWSRRTLPLKILPYMLGLMLLLFSINLILFSYITFLSSLALMGISLYYSYKLKKYSIIDKNEMIIFDNEFNNELGTNYHWE